MLPTCFPQLPTPLPYRHKQEEQINYVNFEEIIQEQESIPKLTEEQCNSLEGKISKDEVLSTLKRMKNGTSPGSDGFMVEFLKFFWNDIGSLFVHAIKESFRKERLKSHGPKHVYNTLGYIKINI